MDVFALLKTCEAQDIRLSVADETLHCDAPTGVLTADIRAAIAWHKGELLALLTTPPNVSTEPAVEPARHCAVHNTRCEGTGLTVTPGVGWDCPTCQQQYRVPIVPAGVLHLWSALLQDDIYGTESLSHAQVLWATHRIAVYTPGELRRLRQLQRADPGTFPDKLTGIHRFKREFGCHVDAVIIPHPQEQES
jgi:hypothetical protein